MEILFVLLIFALLSSPSSSAPYYPGVPASDAADALNSSGAHQTADTLTVAHSALPVTPTPPRGGVGPTPIAGPAPPGAVSSPTHWSGTPPPSTTTPAQHVADPRREALDVLKSTAPATARPGVTSAFKSRLS